MEDNALVSIEAAYEDPGKQVPMGFMAAGGAFYYENASHWWDQPPPPSFTSQTCIDNTNQETSDVNMSVSEEAIRYSNR